jgi:hypothetical protein
VQATGIGALTVRLTLDGNKVLGELSKGPFNFAWNNVTPGKHTLTASLTDSVGQSASASISVSVQDLAPNVQIKSPSNGDNFTEGTDITLTATATDPDDSIKDVTFWVNHRVLGKATQSKTDPTSFSFTWSGAKANFYLIQAVATNSNDTKTTSDSVYISVSKK